MIGRTLQLTTLPKKYGWLYFQKLRDVKSKKSPCISLHFVLLGGCYVKSINVPYHISIPKAGAKIYIYILCLLHVFNSRHVTHILIAPQKQYLQSAVIFNLSTSMLAALCHNYHYTTKADTCRSIILHMGGEGPNSLLISSSYMALI